MYIFLKKQKRKINLNLMILLWMSLFKFFKINIFLFSNNSAVRSQFKMSKDALILDESIFNCIREVKMRYEPHFCKFLFFRKLHLNSPKLQIKQLMMEIL